MREASDPENKKKPHSYKNEKERLVKEFEAIGMPVHFTARPSKSRVVH